MWRIVCYGPGPRDRPRRVVDRGPLHVSKARATAIADWLRSTGCYESVKVEVSHAPGSPGLPARGGGSEPAPDTADAMAAVFE